MCSLKQSLPTGRSDAARTGSNRWLGRLLTVALLLMVVSPGSAADSKEYQLKAAFIYNFTKFVEWPAHRFPETNSPIIIGILGKNPFNDELEKIIKDRNVNGHGIVVKNIISPAEATSVHLVFVSAGEEEKWEGVLKSFQKTAILTVGESEKFAASGGMINFTRQADKVRFEINQDSTDEAGLKVNAQLLKLATTVRRKPKGL
jgi:hypothetical protein